MGEGFVGPGGGEWKEENKKQHVALTEYRATLFDTWVHDTD